jgi:DNA-binding NtrC family response regulator
MGSILVVEDEEVLAKNVRRTLEKIGHEVQVAPTGADAVRLFQEVRPDLVLLDLRLPDAGGLDILARLRELDSACAVLMMTAYASVEDAVRAIQLGACDYLQKPLHLEDLKHAVERALGEARLREQVTYYRDREATGAALDTLLGTCEAMERLRARIRRLCSLPVDAAPPTVLVGGETGTGKGLVARVLHFNGPRANQPFIDVNCAAIPDNLVEAELFGYEKGAFTDAKSAKNGLFQAADKGSLFLDEIGCLTPPVQGKILKAIEEKRVRPVGGRSDRAVDIQIIAATNSPLAEMARAGTFREDLYYRLQVAPLDVPPLRERGGDLLLLADTFLRQIAHQYRSPIRGFTAAARRAIETYRWPGNVRELRNVIDRAVLFCDGDEIDVAALGLPGPAAAAGAAPVAFSLETLEIPDAGIRLEEVERGLIQAALRKTGGNQSEAARLLGLSRDTLRYRIEKFALGADKP